MPHPGSAIVTVVDHALFQDHPGVLREQGIASSDQSRPGDIYHPDFSLGRPAYFDLSVRCWGGCCCRWEAKDNRFLESVTNDGGKPHGFGENVIDGTTITSCDVVRDLGIMIDNQLKFHDHTTTVAKKANRLLAVIHKTFQNFDHTTFINLYKSYIRPVLEYGNIIWPFSLMFKLYEQVKSHERNMLYVSRYLKWKCLEAALKKKTGIDAAMQRQIDEETTKWKEIPKCILDVILFLAEHNLPFRGSSSKIGDGDNGLFLGILELLSKHNKVLEMHLNNVKQHQISESRMQTHYLSWRSQNEFIEACSTQVLDALLAESKNAIYYSVIVDATPDVSHTEQITFVLRYVHRNEENVWDVKERFLLLEDCGKKKGKDIADLLCNVLEKNEIDLQNCRGQGTQPTLDEEIRLFALLTSDLHHIRESWSAILDEARTVASNLGFEEQFKQKRQRKRKALPDEDPRNAHIHANEEDRFRIDVFYVALDKLTQEIELRSQKAANINDMFSFIWQPSKGDADSNVAKLLNLQNSTQRT
ncbi:uncharacterized protein [Dysidea avara]|uniref:uncharacterized protein n=1 Tax=Dysidea avara TaxID=196820 RepID=UPI0033190A17